MKCDLQVPEIPNWDYNALTVGHVFFLNCEGAWGPMDKESLELRTGDKNPDTLRLLRFEQKSDSLAQLKLVSYLPGEHKFQAVQMVDKEHSVLLGDVSITVASVQDQQQPVQEPYGPMGPVKLDMPIIYTLAVIAVVLLLAFVIGFRIWRRKQKQKLLLQMRVGESALAPYHEFYRGIRELQRKNEPDLSESAKTLNELYRLYIGRTFKTPALAWGDRRILADIASGHRDYMTEQRKNMLKIFAELRRALKSKTLTQQDIEQLTKIVRDHADQTERLVGQK